MNNEEIIDKTKEFVKSRLENDGSGHDWFHIERVLNNAVTIAKEEKADLFVVELGALLHDVADWKFNDDSEGPRVAREWLESLDVEEKVISEVCDIIKNVSYKGKDHKAEMKTQEGKIVQDADRLEALGAIGIARCFVYSGSKGRKIYDPEVKPGFDNYIEKTKGNGDYTAINHFYEKLLLLKDLMNTETGKKMAQQRHEFMEKYLEQFYKEVEGQ